METLKKEFKTDGELAEYLYSKVSLTQEDLGEISGNSDKFWGPFLDKIFKFNVLLEVQDIF